MADNRIIPVGYAACGRYRTRAAYMYDYGQVYRLSGFPEGMLPAAVEVHFSTGSGSITAIGSRTVTEGVEIWDVQVPDDCFLRVMPVRAWIYLHDGETDGETKYEIETPIIGRGPVTHEEPTPTQQTEIEQAIVAFNAGVARAETAADAAESAQESAEGYAESAGDSAITAINAASGAGTSATQAAGSAAAAAASATDANASREAADVSATNAGMSERAAAGSAQAAAGSATAAAGSATQAAQSAGAAAASAQAAAGSATNAAGSAEAAEGSAAAAGIARTGAESAQTAAAGSAQASAGSATQAAGSATQAAGSATQAAGSATAAAGSATAAAGSAAAAAGSAAEAAQTVAGIEAAGAAQIAAIEDKGEEVLDSIPADYSELTDDVESLKSALNNSLVKTVNPGDLTKFPCKQNTYINNNGEEVAVDGYDTYYIPCAVGSFVHIDWTAHSTHPWTGLNDIYAIKLHDNNGNFYSILGQTSIYGKISKPKKELIVIPTTVDSTVTITVLRAYAENTVVSVGDYFAHTNPESNTDIRKTTMSINEQTAVLSIFYFRSDQSSDYYNFVGELADIARTANLNVRQGDKIQFTGVKQGLAGLGTFHTVGQTVRINTESTTNLLYTAPSDGILSVFYLYGGDYDAVIIPREQITISADHVYGLTGAVQQELTEFQGEIDALDDRMETVENELNSQSVSYETGSSGGYYRVNSAGTAIEEKASSSFTKERVEVAGWMNRVIYTIVSNTGISDSAVYLAFTDASDTLIINDSHSVGLHETLIPSNAKYIYMSFYGATFNTGFTIKPDAFVRESDLGTTEFNGLSGVAFGTSLTYRAQTTGGYLNFLPDLSGITFDNQGVGSSCILGDGGNLDMLAKVKAYAGYTGKRVALLEGFVNDWYGSKTLGTWKDTGETTVCGCVRSALNYMLSQNANMTVFLILDHCGRNYNSVDCSTTATRSSGLTQYEYYSEIEKVANSLGIPVIREFAEGQISENTPQYLADNIHCNSLGAKQSADFIWSKMKTFMPNAIS